MGLGRVAKLPRRVAEALAARVAEQFEIAFEETLSVLTRGTSSRAFASSAVPAIGEPLDYVALVKTAKLTTSDEAFWIELAADNGADAAHGSPTTRRGGAA
jgi:hypothetical protein